MHSNSNDCWRRSRLYYYATTLVLDTPPLSPSYLPSLGMIEKENKGEELGKLYHVLEEGAIYRIYMYAHTHTHIQYMCVIYILNTLLSLNHSLIIVSISPRLPLPLHPVHSSRV